MQLTDNILVLGNRYFNHFIVGKKKAAIIDCGVTGSITNLQSQLHCLDRRPDIKYLIALHGHFDHVCGIPSFRQLFPEARVLSSKMAQKILSTPKIVSNFFYQDEKMSEELVKRGILADKPEPPDVSTIEIDQIIGEGDIINLDTGLKLEVIDAPGHSPCGLACYFEKDKAMFLSDAGGYHITDEEIFPAFFFSYKAYIDTIKKLKGFKTEILCFPHGKILMGNDVKVFYEHSLKSTEAIFNEIKQMLDSGIDEGTIQENLFSKLYRKDLQIYTSENIKLCMKLLVKRVKDCL